jgi:hypothetical protein
MQAVREIPATSKGRAFRRLAWVIGIASIVGIADQLRGLFWFALAGIPEGGGPMYAARRIIILAGWILLCWLAVLAVRKNTVPPTWALLAIPVLIWTVLFLPTSFPAG